MEQSTVFVNPTINTNVCDDHGVHHYNFVYNETPAQVMETQQHETARLFQKQPDHLIQGLDNLDGVHYPSRNISHFTVHEDNAQLPACFNEPSEQCSAVLYQPNPPFQALNQAPVYDHPQRPDMVNEQLYQYASDPCGSLTSAPSQMYDSTFPPPVFVDSTLLDNPHVQRFPSAWNVDQYGAPMTEVFATCQTGMGELPSYAAASHVSLPENPQPIDYRSSLSSDRLSSCAEDSFEELFSASGTYSQASQGFVNASSKAGSVASPTLPPSASPLSFSPFSGLQEVNQVDVNASFLPAPMAYVEGYPDIYQVQCGQPLAGYQHIGPFPVETNPGYQHVHQFPAATNPGGQFLIPPDVLPQTSNVLLVGNHSASNSTNTPQNGMVASGSATLETVARFHVNSESQYGQTSSVTRSKSATRPARLIKGACSECRRKKQRCNGLLPCGNCLLRGVGSKCDANVGRGASSFQTPTNIEGPLSVECSMSFDDSKNLDFQALLQASSIIGINPLLIKRSWEFGCHSSALLKLFKNLPNDLLRILNDGISDLSFLVRLQSTRANNKLLTQSLSRPEDLAETSEDVYSSFHTRFGHDRWIAFETNKTTGDRSACRFGPQLSHLFGLHHEEFKARFLRNEVDLPWSELDYLTILLDICSSCNSKSLVRYWPIIGRVGGKIDGMIVRVTIIREFDKWERLERVIFVYDFAEEEEFNKDIRSQPSLWPCHKSEPKCDFQTILKSHRKDIHVMGKISQLRRSLEGSRRLDFAMDKVPVNLLCYAYVLPFCLLSAKPVVLIVVVSQAATVLNPIMKACQVAKQSVPEIEWSASAQN
eukprot:763986-Hanusia_phi.AAC.4